MTKGYDDLDINDNLVMDLHFIGGDTKVVDYSKRRNSPIIVNTPARDQLTSGFPIMEFIRANSDYLTIANADAADLKFTTEFTLSFWLYWTQRTASNLHNIIGLTNGGTRGWRVYLQDNGGDGNRIWISMSGGSATQRKSNSGIISLATWYHVGIIYNNGTLNIYINTVVSNNTTSTYTTIAPETTRNLAIGRNETTATEYADMKLGDLKAYNKAIDPDYFKEIFESQRKFVGI